jgi:hypothetical protein
METQMRALLVAVRDETSQNKDVQSLVDEAD